MTEPHKTPTERAHEIALAAITRQPRSGAPSMEVGETAQGRRYVKSVTVFQHDDEGWRAMADRAVDILLYAQARLAPEEDETVRQLQKTVAVIDAERAKRRPRKPREETKRDA